MQIHMREGRDNFEGEDPFAKGQRTQEAEALCCGKMGAGTVEAIAVKK